MSNFAWLLIGLWSLLIGLWFKIRETFEFGFGRLPPYIVITLLDLRDRDIFIVNYFL
jgi:hypothetical protein